MAIKKILKDDKVRVISGKSRGTEGKVKKVLYKENKIIVEGVNIVKKHKKPDQQNETGKIISEENPIHLSNVMLIDTKTKKRTRVGTMINKNGHKVRLSKVSKAEHK